MNTGTEQFQYAVSFDWESLVPIVFFVLYGLSQFLGKKKKGEEEGEEPEMTGEERARRIREEIRRKIEARRHEKELEERPLGHPPPPVEYDPTVPERHSRPKPPTQPRPPVKSPQLQPASVKPMRRGDKAAFARANLQERLDEQRRVLERSKVQVLEAQEKAHEIEALAVRNRANVRRDLADAATFRRQVIVGLREPNSLRKAVLYREILDPPVGMR